MQFAAVMFDLDDTLCDTIGCRWQRLQTACTRLLRDFPHLDDACLIARALETTGEPRAVRGLGSVLQELGLAETDAGREALQLFATDYHPLVLFPDVQSTLRWLSQKYVLGVITNGEERLQQEKLHRLGLTPYIRNLTTSTAAGYEKPDRRIFAHALQAAGVRPWAGVFVGDRLDVDVAGAQRAGMKAIWFNHWGGQLTADSPRPDRIITRFAELPSALTRL